MERDPRELMEQGVAGLPDVDLVPAALAGARARARRRRAVVAGGGVLAAAALAVAIAVGGGGPWTTGPADDPSRATQDSRGQGLEANRWLLDAAAASGMGFDYQPIGSPAEALAPDAIPSLGVVAVGRVTGARELVVDRLGHRAVELELEVTRWLVATDLPDGDAPEDRPTHLTFDLQIGTAVAVTEDRLAQVEGPVLLLAEAPEQAGPDADRLPVYPLVDGLWFDVPEGIDGPWVRYADLPGSWPEVQHVDELADVLDGVLQGSGSG